MIELDAISLWQPWGWALFVEDAKVHETRHWPAPQRLMGKTVLVHAAKRPIGADDLSPALTRFCTSRLGENWRPRKVLTFGAFLGTAILAACFRIGRDGSTPWGDPTPADLLLGDWSAGRYAWRLENRVALPAPIPAKGQQGWWKAQVDLGASS